MESTATLLTIILAFLTILGIVTGFFKQVLTWVSDRIRGESPYLSIPRKSIRIIPTGYDNDIWWHMGKRGKEPIMSIAADFKVTNITRVDILLLTAELRRPKRLGWVHTRDVDSNVYGEYYIPTGETTKIRLHIMVAPPVCKEGEEFIGDIAIIDQFDNHHWVKRVRFKYS